MLKRSDDDKKSSSIFWGGKVYRQRKFWLRVREKGPSLTLVWAPPPPNGQSGPADGPRLSALFEGQQLIDPVLNSSDHVWDKLSQITTETQK